MKLNGDRRPEDIQAEIERTRNHMGRTLSAIEQRLSPGQLVDEGLDYLRHSGAREYVVNLGEAAKRDPLPLALVGVGLAWLMMSDRRSRGEASADVHSVSDGTSQVKDTAAHLKAGMSRTSQKLSDTASAARDRAGQVTDAARRQAERVRGGFDRLLNEQPLALGAIGLALGAMLGGSAPRTREEDELMGDASERVRDDLNEMAREKWQRAEGAAGAAADAARTAAVERLDAQRRPDGGGVHEEAGGEQPTWSPPERH